MSLSPENIYLTAQAETKQPTQYENCYAGEVKHTLYTGPHIHCIIELTTGEQLRVLQPNHMKYQPGTLVYVSWSANDSQMLADHGSYTSSLWPAAFAPTIHEPK